MVAACAVAVVFTAWWHGSEAFSVLLRRASALLSASSSLPASVLKLSAACPTEECNQQFSSDGVEQPCLCCTSALLPVAPSLS